MTTMNDNIGGSDGAGPGGNEKKRRGEGSRERDLKLGWFSSAAAGRAEGRVSVGGVRSVVSFKDFGEGGVVIVRFFPFFGRCPSGLSSSLPLRHFWMGAAHVNGKPCKGEGGGKVKEREVCSISSLFYIHLAAPLLPPLTHTQPFTSFPLFHPYFRCVYHISHILPLSSSQSKVIILS